MKNLLHSFHSATRPMPIARAGFVVRSVMPGSVIVPGLRYSIPLHPSHTTRQAGERIDPDSNRPETRHVLSEQRI